MQKHILSLDHKTISVYPAEQADSPLLLTFLSQAESDELAASTGRHITLVSIDEPQWERAFTPWAAPAAFKKAPDFSGGADDYLTWLTNSVLPEVLQTYALQPQWYGLAGYSLGGLFAAYAAYQNTPFTRFASVSGSLWFDGWAEFITRNHLQTLPHQAYFSVGDKEKNSKNPRMAVVETHTLATQQNWQEQGVHCIFELNNGGHFEQVPQRMAKAIAYLSTNATENI
ncbi:alpha/beta hydrolase [Neisseria animalis]|uniref:Alpha/beta hydrolase n=1 Tax=Neisseria animalis TaxID=492 RepID=A0A5P3MRT8_NEIAN|nr:alpha/beta hydrolase-fold protein [Neisseria animalis]QEY23359.1 alpha/beta hydrolase [Neisseria animalis]ROW33207.1 alpha/beta hydrolase [Neisseria animalis]VEE08757.1 Predicted hydrolase of the alpha/beta superfamily [Neisseria animalis]